MLFLAEVRHDLPPFTQTQQEVWQRMPLVLLLEPPKLLLGFGKLKIVHVVQSLGGLDLYGDVCDQNQGGVLLRLTVGEGTPKYE